MNTDLIKSELRTILPESMEVFTDGKDVLVQCFTIDMHHLNNIAQLCASIDACYFIRCKVYPQITIRIFK